jgi:hypothetical protein
MRESDVFGAALAAARDDIARSVRDWRAQGRHDEALALMVDGESGGSPRVTALSRTELEQTIVAFDPTIAIEFAKHKPGHAPAVVELRDFVRRIYWVDLATSVARPAF